MNAPVWIGWVLVGVLAVLSIALLMGKGSFLIAGYNTTSKQEKQKYDVRKLCGVVGVGLSTITIIMAINLAYEYELPNSIQWLTPWGYLIPIATILILGNTICRKR